VDVCIYDRKTGEERMAPGLLGRVAKEEKIRDPCAEEKPARSRKGEKATYSDRKYLKSG